MLTKPRGMPRCPLLCAATVPLPALPHRWQLPWQQANPWQVVASVTRGERLPLPNPSDLPGPHRLPSPQYEAFLALLVSCWAQSPADRPTFGAVIESLRWEWASVINGTARVYTHVRMADCGSGLKT